MDRVLTETQKIRAELRDMMADIRINSDPGVEGLLGANVETDYFEAMLDTLTDWYMKRGNHWYDGYRQGYEKGKAEHGIHAD